jgi:hypothetical protein
VTAVRFEQLFPRIVVLFTEGTGSVAWRIHLAAARAFD